MFPRCLIPLLASTALVVSPVLRAADLVVTLDTSNPARVLVQAGGRPFAEYVLDQGNKPYLWPVYGPSGKVMTRAYPMADLPGEQKDHPHHRGITFGHESIGGDQWRFPENWTAVMGSAGTGGGDTWHEAASFPANTQNPKAAENTLKRLHSLGKVVHLTFTESKASGGEAVLGEVCGYLDASGKRFLTEERRMTFRATDEVRSIDFDQDLIASDGPVRLDDRKDAGLEIRVPSSMAVERGEGGQILNSDGVRDAAAWAKTAKWCAYSGPVEGETLGIAILGHPSTYRYPTRWHVRTYGLFAANPFGSRNMDRNLPDVTTTIQPGERVRLRHRFVFFKGHTDSAALNAAFEAYALEKR
jgi:hypothetical protein